MSTHLRVASLLAHLFADTQWDEAALLERCESAFGKRFRWCRPLVKRIMIRFPQPPPREALEIFLVSDEGFNRTRLRLLSNCWPVLGGASMRSKLPFDTEIPSLCNTRQLADWLGLRISELDWFADLKGLLRNTPSEKLSHYRYRVLAKRFGAVRLIESPKPRLKAAQRQILRQILDKIRPHDAAHGFRQGRSIATFVAPHIGQAVVARMDLTDFFPCIQRARVAAVFRTAGYPDTVARLLGGLCTNIAPAHVWAHDEMLPSSETSFSLARFYGVPHLPQGSPTSPAIANLCAYRLDCRLAGLARVAGAEYTRYADDLAFSGDADFARKVERFLVHVAATVSEEGFVVHHRKTRIMRGGVRQHLAGIVVNRRMNVRRTEYDRLKATLMNCYRHGTEGQNRAKHRDFRAHLQGRIAFVAQVHPERGRRLRAIFDSIDW
jgi:retron-type reverse transcriptase